MSLKQPTEAGVNTNQSHQSAQGQFATADAFAEKNSKSRANREITQALTAYLRKNSVLTCQLDRIGNTVRHVFHLLLIRITFNHHADQRLRP